MRALIGSQFSQLPAATAAGWVTATPYSAAYYVCFHLRNHTIRHEVACVLLACAGGQRGECIGKRARKRKRKRKWQWQSEAKRSESHVANGMWFVWHAKLTLIALARVTNSVAASNRNSWQRELNEPAVIAQSNHPPLPYDIPC